MFSWLKNRSKSQSQSQQSQPPEAQAGAGLSSGTKLNAPGKFGLEALEPRVLLSGDSPFAEVYRSLLSDEQESQGGGADVYSQQVDAETSAEIAAAQGADFASSPTQEANSVAWPEGWGDDTDPAAPSTQPQETAQPALLERASTSPASPEIIQAEGENLSADTSDQLVSSNIPSSELPRGPPLDEQVSAAEIAAESIQINDLGLSDSSEPDDGEAFAIQFLLVSEVGQDGLARAPPVADALSLESLAPVLEEARRLWAATGISSELVDRLAGIQVQVSDLAAGELGEADHDSITLDTTAAGRGWFVDQTPGDNAEFSHHLSGSQLAALEGSAAHGRIDLLTVLVHELGHVLGLDHTSGLAVMGENLNTGQRVLLDGNAGAASGAQQTMNLLVGDQIDLALQAFADAQELLAAIQAAAAQQLPLIGMSLDELLLQAGFDLFGEFDAAVAPLVGAVGAGTLTQRFAELEELLEDAFALADVGGNPTYDNAEIELAYDAIDDWLDIIFAFELGDTDEFVLDEIGLTWQLGLEFTLGMDFAVLATNPANTETGLELTLGLTGSVIVDTAEFDASGVGRVELDLLEMLGGSAPSVNLQVTGDLNIADAIYIEGTFGFERRTGESLILANGSTSTPLANIDYTLISGEDVAGFFGNGPYVSAVDTPNAVGLFIDDVDFSLLLLNNGGFDYTALKTTGGVANFVGIPDLAIGASAITVALNSTSDTAHPNKVLDFNNGVSDRVAGIAVDPLVGPTLDFEGEDGAILEVSGDFALDAFGFVVLVGTFNLVKQTDVSIDDGTGGVATFNADVLSLSLSASGFVGAGGSLSQDPLIDPSTATVVTTGAVGFSVPATTLDLVILQDTGTPANKYTGLQLSLVDAGLIGIGDLGLTVSGTVQVNKGPAAGRLNWSQVTGTGQELTGVTLEMDQTVELAIREGSVALDAFGFVVLAGTFTLVKQTDVTIDDGKLAEFQADVLSLSITANGFAGVGGSLSAANDSGADVIVDDAIGFNLPSSSLDLVLVQDRSTPANKYTGLQVGLTNVGLVGMPDDFRLTASGQVQVNKGPAGGRLDWTAVTGGTNELPDVTLTMDETVELAVRDGSIALDAFGFAQLAVSSFTLVKQTDITIDDGNLDPFQADVLSLSLTASGFAGVGGSLSASGDSEATVVVAAEALGFNLPSGSVDLVLVKDRATPANKYTGLQIGVTNAGLIGIEQLGITVSGTVQVNKGPAAGRLDWTAVTGEGNALADTTLAIDNTVDLAIAGSLALDAFGFVLLAGTFSMVKQTNVTIDDGNLAAFQADVLSLSIEADIFAGVGGALSGANDSEADVVIGEGAIGFHVTGGSLDLVLVQDRGTPANKYTGIQVGLTAATLVGMPSGFGLTASGAVQVNKGPAAGRLDWTAVTGDGNELTTVTLSMDETMELSASGSLALDIFGFVQVSGSFALETYSTTVTLAGQTTETSVDVLAFGMADVDVFVGDGPYFNADGTLHANSGDAVGLLLEDTSLAVALFTHTSGPGSGTFHAISARAQSIEFVGVDLGGSDSFSVQAQGYRLEINGGSTGDAINFAAGVGSEHATFEVRTGQTSAVEFKFSSALERVAIEQATIAIGDFIYVSGGFSFTRQSNLAVELTGTGTDTVNVLALGAGNVDVFVGSGPYFVAGQEPDPTAVGLALENVNFGLLLMRSVSTPANQYTTIVATSDRVGLVGLDSIKLSAAGVTVEYNGSNRADNKVIDFSDHVYELDTGNGTLDIDYDSKVLRASVEEAELQIDSYVYISGGLAFERGPSRQVQLTTGTAMVSSIEIGAQDLTMFFGVGGPYWNDLDGDKVVDSNETNPDAMGFAITDADLAMTLLKPDAFGTQYLGLHATADQIGFVGIEGFALGASTVAVDLNIALGANVTSLTPVVNFASAYTVDERLALFNVFDTDGNHEISVDELTAAIGTNHGATASLTTTEELVHLLNAGGAPPDPLLIAEVLDQLTGTFKTSARVAAINAIDSDQDGKFDPIGYEIKTGSGFLYLAADSRQIHASADNVQVNLAEFLYVNGSIALDIGSRETVTVRTGIPASLGTLATEAVELINAAIDGLEGGLATLKTAIQGAIDDAIDDVRAEIEGLLDEVIDSVVDYLKNNFDSYVGSLSDLSQAQLDAVIAGVTALLTDALDALAQTLTVDGLINQLLDPIVGPIIDALPEPLQGPVGDLLDTLLEPIRQRVSSEFGATLEAALGGAVSRIAGSVSIAIEAALQAAAATATATFDAAVDQAREEIETAISTALDPQFDRVSLELNRLLARATASLDPLFDRLRALTEIQISDDFATMEGVEVEVTALGISNASAFVGLPPTGGFDFDQPFADQVDDAVGLYIDGLDMAVGIFKPVLGNQLPTFTAVKLHADDAGFSDGGNEVLELFARGIEVELNLGGPIVPAAGALFGNATIDFAASFPAHDGVPVGYAIQTNTSGDDPIYIDFEGGELIRASVEHAELHISEFVHITGSIAFEKGTVATVDVTGGLTGPLVDTVLDELDLSLDGIVPGLPWTGADTAELSFMTIGASDVHAFVGIGGPYWTDADFDEVVDDGELSSSAKGLWIEDFDFGMAIMTPTNVLDFAKYFALKATANEVSIVNIEGVEITADDLLVELNQSTPSIYGLPLFPVVDFAGTYASERQALFDLLASGDGSISASDLDAAIGTGHGVTTALTNVDQLMTLLDIAGAPPNGVGANGILTLDEVTDRLTTAYKDTSSGGKTNLERIQELDADGDGKFDPAGYEVNTGSEPVYLDMDSSLIRAQGFLELNLFDMVYLTGSVAFELGPTQEVTLSDSTAQVPSTKTVTTMTIGAADVTAFIGANGPYWTDLDGNHEVTRDVTDDGNGRIDADESAELNDDSVGFEITDLDIGIMVMASTNPVDLGVYVAAKLNVNSFGLVGIAGLTATGSFDVALNVGVGLSGITPSLAVVDFTSSFSEATALFALMDTSGDGILGQAEQDLALHSGYVGESITTVAQLVSLLNASNGPPDDYLTMSEVRAKLKDSFETSHQTAIDALDVDDNTRLNTGFEVNTGNPAAPVVLDFEEFQVSVQLGGKIELANVFRLYGLFLFEVDSSGLKAFVAAGLEVGPDIGATQGNKVFVMNALGALVINEDGIAADINVSASVGGALSNVLQLDVSARLVLNTTGETQTINIPARYAGYLDGTSQLSELPGTGLNDVSQLSGLTRSLVKNSDGSATFTISPGAPSFHGQYDATGAATVNGGFDAPGSYFLVTLDGELTIANTFVIDAAFLLKVNTQGLELGFNGTIDLGGFATLDVEGGAVIQGGVFAAYIDLAVDIDLNPKVDISITGAATLQINSSNAVKRVYDAQGVGHDVLGTTFMVAVDATIDLFGVLTAEGTVSIGVEDGVFSIAMAGKIDFFNILDIDVSGYFSVSSSGAITFNFTGSLGLDLTAGSGASEFGITGNLSVTLKNSGFSGHGSVGLVIFGEDINIASGTVSVDWETGDWLIRAEGPLGVWVEVTSSDSFPYFSIDGGLGLFDAIFEALGDAVDAVGEALVAAAEAVADAFEDLGEAILDFGADVLEFFDGLLTDIADLAKDVFNEVSSWFEDSKTVVVDLTKSINPFDYYSYSASLSGGVLTITNASASRIALAIVNGNLVVDAPDVTRSVAVATSINYERDYTWDGWPPYGEWSSWYEVSRTTQYRDVTFSNMRNFAAGSVTKIVINGASIAETLILDKGSISIDTDVYGNGGDDTIVTGQGNDRVWGGEGDDTIFTYGGNDQLRGEGGHDTLMGGTGNDELYGGAGNDLLDENDGRVSPEIAISETNIMIGGDGIDIILGSPGNDTIEGGADNDTLVGLSNDDTYVFVDGYGTDTLVDYNGKETLDFSAVTGALTVTMTDTGLTASTGTGNLLSISHFVSIKELNIGTGDDVVTITTLPLHRLDITDAGGTDIYDFDLDSTDSAQTVARVDIQDSVGSADRIDLDVNSTGFPIYLHPQAVLLNNLEVTFSSEVELLNLTDHAAAQTTVTTAPDSGPKTLLIKSGVTITSALGQQIRLLAKADFMMQVEAVITTAGNVVIRGDDEDLDSTGATINLFGTINADQVTVYGNDDNDTVNITNVVSGAQTTVYAGAGNDTFNVGTSAPAAGGNLDRIGALLTINGEDGLDTLNADDSGDDSANTGAMSDMTITGLDMAGGMAYATIETLNIGLGTAGDVFTIHSTHTGVTHLNANIGDDVVNVRTIAGTTTIDGESGDETFNVGSNAAGTIASPNTNTGGQLDGIGASLTINGNDPASGSDWLILDDTGDSDPNSGILTATTITGLDMAGVITYGTIEHLIVSLGSGGNTLTITNTHGAATDSFQEDTTVNSGSGADTVDINAVTDLLYVNGQAGGDVINVNGTGADSVSTLNGDAGNDIVNVWAMSSTLNANGGDEDDTINVSGTNTGSVATLNGDAGNDTINVRAMNGTVYANGGNDTDTVNVGSVAPTLPGVPTDQQGTIDAINGLLTVNGGNGSDSLNVDDSHPAAANKSGTLTYNSLSGLALEHAIGYSELETMNIWLATGDNSFTISSTHAGATTLSTALGNDTVNVDGASGTLTINAEAGDDVVNVRATGLGSRTNIYGQDGNDTINLSDHSPLLPDAYPTVQNPPAADSEGNIDAIDGLIAIDGGAGGTDVINIDDSRNAANKAGTLTSTTLRGLEWTALAGVNYLEAEDFNLWLGTGTDGLYIDSTHAGTTDVFLGDGNATVNQHDDTVAIKSIGGITTIHGQRGNDFLHVNVQAPSANEPSFFTAFKAAAAAAANDELFNDLFTRTHVNGLGAVLNLHGDGDSDRYTVNLAGQGQALVNVHDNGAPNNGVDTLIINGADVVSGLGNQPNDTFLLRHDFVALLNDSADTDPNLDQVERVNYDQNINARLVVNGLGGDDKFVTDDNSTTTTLDGGDGDDIFQMGQIFGTLRDAAASVGAGDVFDTTPVIIGVIRDPQTNAVIFDPTSFDPATQNLSEETINKINAAIQYQRDHGGLALDGVAYVSQGVSHATTVFGGNGEDTFNVYHNKGTLRLEGEAGNDTFTVRAFVTIDLSVQAGTEVNGGEGTDTINYAINAPVNIDGGAGFDKVVVLGTPFNDSFVVSSEGIFGAGLNVKFTNVEAAELDTLEGDDTIFILGTSEDIVTTVIGGLGNDTINVMGDVTQPIVSNDMVGSSGVIAQGLTSTDADYNLVGVRDVAVNVLFSASDSLVNITPTGEPLLTSEAGLLAHYSISLVDPGALGTEPVYLTVSAGAASSTDRRTGGAGVLVSVNGGAFTNALVLTFDSTSASSVFTIDVMAIDDTGAEGPRVALISHSINSANTAFDELALIDIFVDVVDNDQPGLDIRHVSADGSVYGDSSTEVLENGFGDVYTVALTVAPANGETVTVTLVNDSQVTVGSSTLTFTAANWSTPQQVAVTAVDDGLDGVSISRITHVVTSTGGLYSAFPTAASSRLGVTVYDSDTPGAIVQQSGGSTVVVEGGATDGYRVRLTQAPDSSVTLTLRTDMQTRLSGPGVVAVDVTGSNGYFEYAYTFTTATWSSWANITVSANPDFDGPDSKVKSFAAADQNLDQIRGPLIIEGGVGAGEQREFAAPVMLPGETNDVSDGVPGVPGGSPEANDIDILNVFHTDNSDADTGEMSWRTVDGQGHAIANVGLALTGFEMGGDVSVQQGTTGSPSTVYYGGGITYNGFEIVEALLGKGDETLTIGDTGDRDEKDATVEIDHASVTAIHGGGGNDTITITDRGEGALVVYGDTSENGLRYSNNQPGASVHGTVFGNPGNDTIDASGMLEQGDSFVGAVIFGGGGNDIITGSQDDDHLAGGTGSDTLRGQGGRDHVYGDSSFNIDLMLFAQDQRAPFDAGNAPDLAKVDAMFTVVVTAAAGGDTLYGDAGDDVIFGDHGIIDQLAGTRRIMTTGDATRISTTEPENGVADTIHGGADSDILLGGNGGDIIDAGDGNNIVLGDMGYIDYVVADQDASDIDLIASTQTTSPGGADDITAGTGHDIVVGGVGADTLTLGAGHDIGFGDNAELVYDSAASANPATLDAIRSIARGDGGADTIHGNEGDDILVGGYGADSIHGNDGADTLLGDNGELLDVQTLSTLRAAKVHTTDSANSTGGNDTMEGGNDDDILMGGVGGDVIDAGAGRDLVVGDQGVLDSRGAGIDTNPRYRSLLDTRLYGADGTSLQAATAFSGPNVPVWSNWTITVGDGLDGLFGNDYLAGGAGDDTIFGQSGNDTVQGDGSIASRLDNVANSVGASRGTAGLVVVPSFESATDGDDYIEGNAGDDVIFGNLGQDDIVGGSSNLFGLGTVAQRVDGADLIFGGAGTDLARNDLGDAATNVHARDSDMILGDNGNIFRIVGINGTASATPTFNYDNYDSLKIVVRVAELLDYTPGGPDYVPASLATDRGTGDELHGESGDDFIYGMTGNDVLFGESQDDDLIGGWGNDWISGGTGQDGVLGDDGRIFTSRNGTAESLYGVTAASPTHIATPGNGLVADINVAGELNKTVDMTPYNVDPAKTEFFDPVYADDIIYGGLGSDFLHGGSGDDAISGAEAMATFYAAPVNSGNALQFNPATGEFAAYNETQPLKQIAGFFLNFDATEGVVVGSVFSDGDDRIFGDLGNDWLVGGTGRDHLYGGWGNDLLNADDDLGTNAGLNNAPDTQSAYEDIAFGGAGRDRLIANTGGDRLVDWAGEFNSYLVPFNPFGMGTVSRAISPGIPEFLYALSKADGADQTLGGDATRNSEPFGELGLVRQGDAGFGSQTGGPDDPQPGSGGGKK